MNTDKPWGMLSWKTACFITEHYDTLTDVDAYSPIHPCFLYESLWCLIGFLILHLYFKHRKFDGEIFIMYAGWYGLGRFFIEGLRTDSLYIGSTGIRVSQLLSIVLVVTARTILFLNRNNHSLQKAAEASADAAASDSTKTAEQCPSTDNKEV